MLLGDIRFVNKQKNTRKTSQKICCSKVENLIKKMRNVFVGLKLLKFIWLKLKKNYSADKRQRQ